MSTTIVRAADDAAIDVTLTDLETAAQTIKDDLKININIEVAKGANLLKGEDRLGLDET